MEPDRLAALRADPNRACAELPAPLGELFTQQRTRQLLEWRAGGAVVALLGAAMTWFEYAPPFSTEEIELMLVGLLMVGVGIAVVALASRLPHRNLPTFLRDDVVRLYQKTVVGAGVFATFAAADGSSGSVRIDTDAAPLDPAFAARVFEAMHACHPRAVVGYSPERAAQ